MYRNTLYLLFFAMLVSCSNQKELQLALEEAKAEIEMLQAKEVPQPENQLVHIVFLKLKEDISSQEKSKLIQAIRELEEVETLNQLIIGELAQTNDPRFISDHELVFYIWVNNMEDYEVYQKHQLHLSLKKIAKDYLQEAPAIYDFWTL